MSDAEILDSQTLARLKEWGGENLVAQMVQLFLKNSPSRIEQIRAGVDTGDIRETEKGSHSLKSSAANVGAHAVRTISAALERAAHDGNVDEVTRLVPELERAYEQARGALEAIQRGSNP